MAPRNPPRNNEIKAYLSNSARSFDPKRALKRKQQSLDEEFIIVILADLEQMDPSNEH